MNTPHDKNLLYEIRLGAKHSCYNSSLSTSWFSLQNIGWTQINLMLQSHSDRILLSILFIYTTTNRHNCTFTYMPQYISLAYLSLFLYCFPLIFATHIVNNKLMKSICICPYLFINWTMCCTWQRHEERGRGGLANVGTLSNGTAQHCHYKLATVALYQGCAAINGIIVSSNMRYMAFIIVMDC